MLKPILLSFYIFVAAILPISTIIMSKAKKKTILVVLGAFVYIIGSIFLFIANAMMINVYVYCVLSAALIGICVYFAGKMLMHGCGDEDAMVEYGGFALLNTFITKVIAYVPLISMGFAMNGLGGAVGNLDSEISAELINNYNSIGNLEIIIATLNMIATYFTLRIIFVRLTVLKSKRNFIEYLIISFLVYFIGYLPLQTVYLLIFNIALYIITIFYFSKFGKQKNVR